MTTAVAPLTPEQLLKAALGYAERGILVFPCNPENKRPLVKHGFKVATTDPDQIRAWWAKFPMAMIGAATGPRSGFWAVDLDVSDEADGRDTWRALLAEHVTEVLTIKQETPSGGVHYYFRWPHRTGYKLRNSAKTKLGDGIDTRGDGGYVILPPSQMADGRRYRWPECAGGSKPTMSDAPSWLLDLVMVPTDPPSPPRTTPPTGPGTPLSKRADPRSVHHLPQRPVGREQRYAAAALDGECDVLIKTVQGRRGHQLNASAFNLGQLIGGSLLNRPEVEARLYAAAELNGLVAKDGPARVGDTIRRGIEAGIAMPRQRRVA